jgi:hypothetical protein
MWDGNIDSRFELVLADRAERLRGGLVTPNFFSVLGARAALGRLFSPEDEAAGDDDLVVLSHGLWQRLFGGDPGVIGRTVTFTAGSGENRAPRPYTVTGVLPKGFRFTYPLDIELWAIYPWRVVEATPERLDFSGAVARLEPGVSPQMAQARIAGLDPQAEPHAAGQVRSYTRVMAMPEWVSGSAI